LDAQIFYFDPAFINAGEGIFRWENADENVRAVMPGKCLTYLRDKDSVPYAMRPMKCNILLEKKSIYGKN